MILGRFTKLLHAASVWFGTLGSIDGGPRPALNSLCGTSLAPHCGRGMYEMRIVRLLIPRPILPEERGEGSNSPTLVSLG